MKNLNKNLILLVLLFIVFSCNDDTQEKKSNANQLNKETISGKWEVSTVSGKAAAGDDYESFEFNTSGYFIVVIDGLVTFGEYSIHDYKIIELEDFGTMTMVSLDDEDIAFTLTIPGGDEVSIQAVKAAEIDSSSNTDKLCRTWKMVSIDGEAVAGTEFEVTVLFSKAGTYFVSNENRAAQWTWKNSSETILCYSWDGSPTCTGDNEVVVEVTSNELTITEAGGTVYVLEPLSSGSRKPSSWEVTSIVPKKGIFKK